MQTIVVIYALMAFNIVVLYHLLFKLWKRQFILQLLQLKLADQQARVVVLELNYTLLHHFTLWIVALVLTKEKATIIGVVQSGTQRRKLLNIFFKVKPSPVDLICTVHPNTRQIQTLPCHSILRSPQHQIFLAYSNKRRNFLCWPIVRYNLFDPNIRLVVHWFIDQPQLIEIFLKSVSCKTIYVLHALTSEQINVLSQRTKSWFQPARQLKIVTALLNLNPQLVLNSIDVDIVKILLPISPPIQKNRALLIQNHGSMLARQRRVSLEFLPLPVIRL